MKCIGETLSVRGASQEVLRGERAGGVGRGSEGLSEVQIGDQ